MDQSLCVRIGTFEEALAIHSTVPEFFKGSALTLERCRLRCTDRRYLCLVADSGGSPAGYLIAYEDPNSASVYCWMAGVNPNYRQKGILSALVKSLAQWTREQGYAALTIKTHNRHRMMLSFLIKDGFHFIGIEPRPNIEDYRLTLEKRL